MSTTVFPITRSHTKTCWIPFYSILLCYNDAVISCGMLPNPLNGGVMHTQGVDVGAIATYACQSGFQLFGNINRVCQIDRTWNGSQPICSEFVQILNSQPCSYQYRAYTKVMQSLKLQILCIVMTSCMHTTYSYMHVLYSVCSQNHGS